MIVENLAEWERMKREFFEVIRNMHRSYSQKMILWGLDPKPPAGERVLRRPSLKGESGVIGNDEENGDALCWDRKSVV